LVTIDYGPALAAVLIWQRVHKDTLITAMERVMKSKVTVLALAWLASSVALAQTSAPPADAPADRMERLALLLDLDTYQKTEVEKVLNEQHEKMRTEREAARASGTRPSREEMQAKHEANKQELRTKLSGILNETQLKKFEALHEERGLRLNRFGGKKDRGSKDESATSASQ
jgi:hypothetical protein